MRESLLFSLLQATVKELYLSYLAKVSIIQGPTQKESSLLILNEPSQKKN